MTNIPGPPLTEAITTSNPLDLKMSYGIASSDNLQTAAARNSGVFVRAKDVSDGKDNTTNLLLSCNNNTPPTAG